jgi:Flp pilus assembly protein TadG
MNRTAEVKRPRRDSGEALIEIALVLPILLVLSMGMLDFGRAFHAKNILDAAAREGCRVAVVTAPDEAIVKTRVATVCSSGGITPTRTTVSPVGEDRMVTVEVNARFTFVTPGLFALFGSLADPTGINMTGRSTMRKEG